MPGRVPQRRRPLRLAHFAVQLALLDRQAWLVRAMRPCATREASLVDRRGFMLADTSAVLWEGLSRLVSPKELAISVACTDSAQGKAQRVWDGRVLLHDERGAGASYWAYQAHGTGASWLLVG